MVLSLLGNVCLGHLRQRQSPEDAFQEDFREFLMGEVRYASLTRSFPQNAEARFKKAEEDMKERYETYRRMAGKAD